MILINAQAFIRIFTTGACLMQVGLISCNKSSTELMLIVNKRSDLLLWALYNDWVFTRINKVLVV